MQGRNVSVDSPNGPAKFAATPFWCSEADRISAAHQPRRFYMHSSFILSSPQTAPIAGTSPRAPFTHSASLQRLKRSLILPHPTPVARWWARSLFLISKHVSLCGGCVYASCIICDRQPLGLAPCTGRSRWFTHCGRSLSRQSSSWRRAYCLSDINAMLVSPIYARQMAPFA